MPDRSLSMGLRELLLFVFVAHVLTKDRAVASVDLQAIMNKKPLKSYVIGVKQAAKFEFESSSV